MSELTTQQKIANIKQEYANVCFKVGDLQHKIEHFSNLQQCAMGRLKDIEVESAKLAELEAIERKTQATDALKQASRTKTALKLKKGVK